MNKLLKLAVLLCFTIAGAEASAAFTTLAVSVVPPVQFPPSDFDITGLRVSAIYGHHRDVYGIDIGALGNITDQDFVGLALSGGFNITHGTTTILGAQMAGLFNYNSQKVVACLMLSTGLSF